MSDHPHDRAHRTRYARPFLAVAFLLQRLGDAAVLWFTLRPNDPALLLRGLAIGSLLCTSVLLIGVWRRLRWARYVLTGLNWVYIIVLSSWVLLAWNNLQPTLTNPYGALVGGALLYAGANVILLRSRRVRHFANK